MTISKKEVLHVANLARLDLEEGAIERFADQIGNILDYMETLNHLDTQKIHPTSHAIFLSNAFRKDMERNHLDREAALSNAPEAMDGAFIVPKVIG